MSRNLPQVVLAFEQQKYSEKAQKHFETKDIPNLKETFLRSSIYLGSFIQGIVLVVTKCRWSRYYTANMNFKY